MYSISSLQLTNFGPFKSTNLSLENQAYLVIGKNDFDPVQKSNGVGKSFILDGIYFALTGEALSNCNNADLINEDEKSALVRIKLSGPVEIIIERKITHYGSTVRVWKDGEEKTEQYIKSSKITEEILSLFGITKEDLCNYYLVAKGYKSFFQQTDSEKTKFLTRIVDLNKIDAAQKEIQQKIKNKSSELNKLEGSLTALSNMLMKIESSDRQEQQAINSQIFLLEKTIEEQEEIKKQKKIEFEKIIDKKRKTKIKIESIENQLTKEIVSISNQIDSKKRELRDAREATCPSCGEKFKLNSKGANIDPSKIEAMENAISKLIASEKEINFQITEKRDELFKIDSFINSQSALQKATLLKISDEIYKLQSVKMNLESKLVKKIDTDSLNKEIEKNNESIELLKTEIDELQQNIVSLSKFRNHSIESAIISLEKETNSQLKSFGSDLRIRIEFDSKLSIRIERGTKIRKRPSGGEMARVDVAMIFALQSMLSVNSPNPLRFCAIDEIIDALDLEGIYTIIKNIRNQNRTCLFITQHEIGSNIPNVIKVVKNKDEFSSICQF